jgi:hypothetical protein
MTRNEEPSGATGAAVMGTVVLIVTGITTLLLLVLAAAGRIDWWWALAPVSILLGLSLFGAGLLFVWGLLMLRSGDIE